MGDVSCNEGREEFTDGIEEANGAIGFGDIVHWLTRFTKDKGHGGEPVLMIDIKLKDCMEDGI